jgi:flagellar biosynthesis chaperone FliJ
MISLGGLVSQKAFGKFEMGKVISNPFATAFIKEGEGEDHEVSMANNSIDTIIKMATELKAKMGEDEKQIPAWIQDHIAKAENLISQASGNYHEYGDSNESVVNEEIKEKDWKTIYNVFVKFLKANTKALEIRVMMRDEAATKKAIESIISGLTNAQRSLKLESVVNEAPNKLKHTISKKEWSKIPKYNKHIGMDGIHYIMKYDDKIGTYLQGVQIVDESVNEDSPCWKGYKQVGMKDKGGRQVPNCVPNESVVNEAPNTGERIQNLNNRIKALRDKLSATKSPEQKKLHSDRLKNALQSLSNIKKDFGIKKEISNKTPKIFVKTAAVEKKIRELMADRKKAVIPYNTEKDPDKKEKLKQILIKLTQQIQGYEKNLIQLRDMEEEYLQQMHADAELDTTGL